MAEKDRQQRIVLMQANYDQLDHVVSQALIAGMPMHETVIVMMDVSDPLGAAFCTGLRVDVEEIKEEARRVHAPVPLCLLAINLGLVSRLLACTGDHEDSRGILEPSPSPDMIRTLMVAFGGMTRGYIEVRSQEAACFKS